MHFGLWAFTFDGLGGWTKKMQNAFMEPGKCILVCGAPSFDGFGEWTKKTQNAFWGPGEMHFGLWGPFI